MMSNDPRKPDNGENDPGNERPGNGHKEGRKGLPGIWLFAILVVASGLLLWALNDRFPSALADESGQISFVRLSAILLVLLLSSLGVRRISKPALSRVVRDGLLWLGVFTILFIGYAYREDLRAIGQRLLGNLAPGYGTVGATGEVAYRRADDNHFYIDGFVGQTPIRFLVDTGASSTVLSPADAERLGFDLENLRYNQVFETANGIGRGASARLYSLEIGGQTFRDVPVSINQAPMSTSLLGISFLERYESFEFRGDTLILRGKR